MPRQPECIKPVTPLVVKLGGSLYTQIADLVPVFRQSHRPLLIVPGGGRFADEVRALSLPDDDAHWSAIRGMDRYGNYIAAFGLTTTDRICILKRTKVLLPYRCTRHFDPLPHSWDVTSDTIAAWVAGRLGLDLVVLKSVDGIPMNDSFADRISQRVETDIVDPCFIPYVLKHNIRTTILNGTVTDRVAAFLRGEQVPGTRIGTTF